MQGDSEKTGLKTAVSEMHDPATPVPGASADEQLALPSLPLELQAAENNSPVPRGRGRPPGAKNKNTEAWRDFILAQYRSPLEALAQTYSMSLAQLIEKIGSIVGWAEGHKPTFDQVMEMLKLQLQAAKELAPYVHQKQPLALEAGEHGLIQLVMNTNAMVRAAGPQGASQAIEVLNNEPEQNQLVTLDAPRKSNQENSNQPQQGIDNEEQNQGL